MHSTLTLRRVLYNREQYGCRLRIRPERIKSGRDLDNYAHIADVMTRWLRRCVRDEPIVMGTARAEVLEWWSSTPSIGAIAPAYRDVKPEHRAALEHRVDIPDARYTECLEIAP